MVWIGKQVNLTMSDWLRPFRTIKRLVEIVRMAEEQNRQIQEDSKTIHQRWKQSTQTIQRLNNDLREAQQEVTGLRLIVTDLQRDLGACRADNQRLSIGATADKAKGVTK